MRPRTARAVAAGRIAAGACPYLYRLACTISDQGAPDRVHVCMYDPNAVRHGTQPQPRDIFRGVFEPPSTVAVAPTHVLTSIERTWVTLDGAIHQTVLRGHQCSTQYVVEATCEALQRWLSLNMRRIVSSQATGSPPHDHHQHETKLIAPDEACGKHSDFQCHGSKSRFSVNRECVTIETTQQPFHDVKFMKVVDSGHGQDQRPQMDHPFAPDLRSL
jgi:hypothetical protein